MVEEAACVTIESSSPSKGGWGRGEGNATSNNPLHLPRILAFTREGEREERLKPHALDVKTSGERGKKGSGREKWRSEKNGGGKGGRGRWGQGRTMRTHHRGRMHKGQGKGDGGRMERGEWSVHSFTPVLIARIVASLAHS